MSNLTNLTVLFILSASIISIKGWNCLFTTEHYGIHYYYRCKCNDYVPTLNRTLMKDSCERTSYWSCNNCKIKDITDDAFKNLTVYVLFLNNNNISTLNKWLSPIRMLEVLHLNHNEIDTIDDDTFANQKELEELYLSNNKISIVKLDAFKETFSLRYLNLSNNLLSELPKGLFRNNAQLLNLNLSNNALTYIENGLFNSMINLITLDLSYNRIKDIDVTAFFDLINLNNFYLQYNDLINFNVSELLEFSPTLKIIGLEGNKWNCNYLGNLLKYLRKRNVSIVKGVEYQLSQLNGIRCDKFYEFTTLKISTRLQTIHTTTTTPKSTTRISLDNQKLPLANEILQYNLGEELLDYLRKIHVEIVILMVICICIITMYCYLNVKHYLHVRRLFRRDSNNKEANMGIISDF